MRSPRARHCGYAILTVALGTTAALFGHADDPKGKNRVPTYEGPGYRADLDGPLAGGGFDSEGVQLMAWLPVGDFNTGANAGNDCWGYTSPSGREYALMGLSNATAFVEITNPGNPVIVETISAPQCTWHDIKVFETYAYVVSECGDGIQVIDMSDIDNGNVSFVRNVLTGGSDTHNVAVNTDSGYLYRTGGSGNGLLIYDLNGNPANPQFVAQWPDRYVHDVQVVTYDSGEYAGREIAFCSSGFSGGGVETGLDILDVTDKGNILQLARYQYPNGEYSHQGWLSEDKQYFYHNDELDEIRNGVQTQTRVMDVSDLSNPFQASTFTSGSQSSDHNLYVRGNLIFEANYVSGLRVFDATDPLAPEEIAFFDTVPGDDSSGTSGLWSNYPFFESGIVLGSDFQRGLFVWQVRSQQLAFAYPNGRPELVDPSGDTIAVEISALEGGELVEGSGLLHYDAGQGFVEVPLVAVGGDLYEAVIPALDCGTQLSYYVSAEAGDGVRETDPTGAPAEAYAATVASEIVTVFADDAETDPGYTVENIALEDGAWERGVPAGGGGRGDPAVDADGSGQCWLTGNRPDNSDVDGGPTRLISPDLDLSGTTDPLIRYARWFTNDDNDIDRLDVHISDDGGGTWSLVESVPGGSGWQEHTFRVLDHVDLTSQIVLRFSATDNPNDSVTEAAIDAIQVLEVLCEDPRVPGDVDGDGDADFDDLLRILAAWGPCPDCPEDLDGNGFADFGDILLVLSNWSAP